LYPIHALFILQADASFKVVPIQNIVTKCITVNLTEETAAQPQLFIADLPNLYDL